MRSLKIELKFKIKNSLLKAVFYSEHNAKVEKICKVWYNYKCKQNFENSINPPSYGQLSWISS